MITGNSDYFLSVAVRDTVALERIILEQLSTILSVEKISSSFAIKKV